MFIQGFPKSGPVSQASQCSITQQDVERPGYTVISLTFGQSRAGIRVNSYPNLQLGVPSSRYIIELHFPYSVNWFKNRLFPAFAMSRIRDVLTPLQLGSLLNCFVNMEGQHGTSSRLTSLDVLSFHL